MVHLCVLEMCEELRWVELWVSKSMEIRRAALSAKVLMGKRSNSLDQVGWKASHACASLKREGELFWLCFLCSSGPRFSRPASFYGLLRFTDRLCFLNQIIIVSSVFRFCQGSGLKFVLVRVCLFYTYRP